MISTRAVRNIQKKLFGDGASIRLHKGYPDLKNELPSEGYEPYIVKKDAFKWFYPPEEGQGITFYNPAKWFVPNGQSPTHIGVWSLADPPRLMAARPIKDRDFEKTQKLGGCAWFGPAHFTTGPPAMSANLEVTHEDKGE